MLLARELNFFTPNIFILNHEDQEYLFIERFDRKLGVCDMERIHQEDFNQLKLNFPEKKYEQDGGCSIKKCIDILNTYCNTDNSKERFLKMIIFNYFIGNCDAHAKNFSLLHNTLLGKDFINSNCFFANFITKYEENIYTLSPVYDLLSTEIYNEFDKNMSMKIGGEYNIENISFLHFNKMCKEIDINEKYFTKIFKEMKNIILEKALNLKTKLGNQNIKSNVFDKIIELIEKKIEKFN